MTSSYNTVSREIGYQGYMDFPPKKEVDQLLGDLSISPNLQDFKKALRLYRFLPEAQTAEQQRIIYMLQLGLSLSKKELFIQVQRRPLVQLAVSYILNLIP
jgi:hypothetical protein